MKILLAHNYYQSTSPSGEDEVFKSEVALLRSRGIKVVTYEKYNDEIASCSDKYKTAFSALWSKRTYQELKALLAREKPDIAHFHNIWYLISPSAYYACEDADVPVVQTLHNFRMFCVNGLLMRDGRVCEECIGKIPWRGIRYGCYRESRIYSIPLALTEYLHSISGTWKKVDAYISLTEFGRKKFTECGLPGERLMVKPNFLSDPPEPDYSYQTHAVFVGRLSREKGISTLLDAIRLLEAHPDDIPTTKIIGDGPLFESLKCEVESGRIGMIEVIGRRSFEETMDVLRHSMFLVLPALCYEGFPMVIREAFACGKPVIASRLGAMAEIVDDGATGLLFEPGNPSDLAEKMRWLFHNKVACSEMGRNARKVFEERYSADKNFQMLMQIYETVIGAKPRG